MTQFNWRAKRLVWEPSGVDGGLCAECIAGTYVIRPAHGGGYEWWLCLKGVTRRVETIEQAQAASQADFDQRWLADSEKYDLLPVEQPATRTDTEGRDVTGRWHRYGAIGNGRGLTEVGAYSDKPPLAGHEPERIHIASCRDADDALRIVEAADTIASLTAERDGLVRDAARYRWIRKKIPIPSWISAQTGEYDDLDAGIDAMMALAAVNESEGA